MYIRAGDCGYYFARESTMYSTYIIHPLMYMPPQYMKFFSSFFVLIHTFTHLYLNRKIWSIFYIHRYQQRHLAGKVVFRHFYDTCQTRPACHIWFVHGLNSTLPQGLWIPTDFPSSAILPFFIFLVCTNIHIIFPFETPTSYHIIPILTQKKKKIYIRADSIRPNPPIAPPSLVPPCNDLGRKVY